MSYYFDKLKESLMLNNEKIDNRIIVYPYVIDYDTVIKIIMKTICIIINIIL